MLPHIGYKKDENNPGKLVIDNVASEIVKRIFYLKLDGKTDKEIADIFNVEGIKTPSEYLKIRGLENRTKKIWTRYIISNILNNEVYLGKTLRGKTQNISYKSKKRIYIKRNEQVITEHTHEAIISEDIYNKIHNKNKYGSKKNNKEKMNTKFLKYIYCGYCKEKMVRRRSRNYITIQCLNRDVCDILCTNKELFIYEDLEKMIITDIQKKFNIYLRKCKNIDLIRKYNEEKVRKIEGELKEKNKELIKIKNDISKKYNEKLMEKINENEYKKMYDELVTRRKKVNLEKNELEKDIKYMDSNDMLLDKLKKVKEKLGKMNKDELTAEEIDELIEKIEIKKNKLKIYYKFSI